MTALVLVLLILLAVFFVLLIWGVAVYNGLVTARNAFRNAFAQIDVQLQRRFDLIPNLVEVAKGYMQHERETLDAVVAARSAAQAGLSAAKFSPGDPAAMAQLAAAQGQLNAGLGRLLAVAEAYPDLKANQNMMQLTEELASTENKVAFARCGDGLQQPPRSVPLQPGRRHFQLPRRGAAGDPGRPRRDARSAEGAVLIAAGGSRASPSSMRGRRPNPLSRRPIAA
jgi:LemA protein